MYTFAALQAAHRFRNPQSAFVALLLSVACALSGQNASAQAHVVEGQQTSVYVDADAGSDQNSGTAAHPLRTLAAATRIALARNARQIGTKVLLNPGIYRETLAVGPTYHHSSAPLTYEAVKTGTAVIAGSDVFTDWLPWKGSSVIYAHPWHYRFGQCQVPQSWHFSIQPIVLRREMVFVNGTPLTQVLSSKQMQAGTFFVGEGAGELFIWPASGTDMSKALVEVAVRPETVEIRDRTDLVLRGLVFEHAATCINESGANIRSSRNVLIDSVQANWNNWGGLQLHSTSDVTVQNSIANYNGGVGFAGWRMKNSLYQYDESDYNNWRGAMGALYDWGMGGTKLMLMHGVTVKDLYAYRNHAQGLWFDTDNRDVTINNTTLSENFLGNLQVELNDGAISMENSTLCSGGQGINLVNSSGFSVQGTRFYNNGGTAHWQAQFYMAGQKGGRHFTDWETHEYHNVISANTTLSKNSFEDAGAQQAVFGTYQTGEDWNSFASTLKSDDNVWYDATRPAAFTLSGGKHATLTVWRQKTGQDRNSSWAPVASPSTGCAVPLPTYADFNLYADAPQYRTQHGKATVRLQVRSFGLGKITLTSGVGPLNSNAAPSGVIHLTANGLPSGVVTSLGAAALSSTENAVAEFTIDVSQSKSQGTVPVTIFARSGARVHSITVNVAISPGA